MSAIDDIAAERRRQIEVEGWTPEHDAKYTDGELSVAAAVYAVGAATEDSHSWAIEAASKGTIKDSTPWPWDSSWHKPTTRRRDLVKAAALLAADIDRMDAETAGSVERSEDSNV
jgi:hypothetical protein